jgi:hypothetical protein
MIESNFPEKGTRVRPGILAREGDQKGSCLTVAFHQEATGGTSDWHDQEAFGGLHILVNTVCIIETDLCLLE